MGKALDLIYGITGKIKDSTRGYIRTALYFMLFFAALLYASVLSGVHLLIKCIVGVLPMGLIILLTVEKPVNKVKWSIPVALMWFGMGALQLVSSLLVSMEYLPMTLVWLVGFPLLFYVWNSRGDYAKLFREVAVGANLNFLLWVAASVLLYPVTRVQYGGIFGNPNAVGQWITFLFPVVIFLHYNEKTGKTGKWIYRCELALIYLFCFISQGRTALVAVGFMTLVLLVLRLVSHKDSLLHYLKQGALFAVCAAAVCVVFFGVNQFSKLDAIEAFTAQFSHSSEELDPEELPEDELLDEEEEQNATGKVPSKKDPTSVDIYGMMLNFISRVTGADKTGVSLEDYSSGRTGIWISVLKSANFWGHPSSRHIITNRNGDVGSNAHNTVLQFCYENGIFAALLFTVMMVWTGLRLLKRAVRKDNLRGINSYMLLVHCGFYCTSLFASVGFPFLYLIGFLYYLSYAVVIDRGNK